MKRDEAWASEFRMIHPTEGRVRAAAGSLCVAAGWLCGLHYQEALFAAGVMLINSVHTHRTRACHHHTPHTNATFPCGGSGPVESMRVHR